MFSATRGGCANPSSTCSRTPSPTPTARAGSRSSADGDKKKAVIGIRDNGSGIDADDLPRVFNRFDRVDEAGVRGEAALGLGLPLTRQFIEAHGGTVDLDREGEGTKVTLTIPRGSR